MMELRRPMCSLSALRCSMCWISNLGNGQLRDDKMEQTSIIFTLSNLTLERIRFRVLVAVMKYSTQPQHFADGYCLEIPF